MALVFAASCCAYLMDLKDLCSTYLRYLTPFLRRNDSISGKSSAFRCGGAASLTGRGSCSTGLRFFPLCWPPGLPGVLSRPRPRPFPASRPGRCGRPRSPFAAPLAPGSTAAYSASARFIMALRSDGSAFSGFSFSAGPPCVLEDARMKSSGSKRPQEVRRAERIDGAGPDDFSCCKPGASFAAISLPACGSATSVGTSPELCAVCTLFPGS
mmetsp:Transcript_30125/g.71749  ORF Transcript_30125/g.71749 Transcript_30125/m.71749 type:complete len:212 (+) Transcript_30125:674-1309(+)